MNTFITYAATIAATSLLVVLGGCAASQERPDEQLASAKTSIDIAEESGAREFGMTALERARDKLSRAQKAAEREQYTLARALATEAQLDAELAASQANRHKAEEALAEINDSIETLRREIERNEAHQGDPS